MWGIIPAAGMGTRIQPLAFSKELLPVGSTLVNDVERPRAVSEFLLERMLKAGATNICFVIAPGKSDIIQYYGQTAREAELCYVVQQKAGGLCDAIFRASSLIHDDEPVLVGLPDTIWFPDDGLASLPDDVLSFLLFPVERPESFDAVVTDDTDRVLEIQVKSPEATSNWIWGAIKMPGRVLHELEALWLERGKRDEFLGTLVNAYLARGGRAIGLKRGEAYVDVGTLNGYREAMALLSVRTQKLRTKRPTICSSANRPLAVGGMAEVTGSSGATAVLDAPDVDASFGSADGVAANGMRRSQVEQRVRELGDWFHNLDLNGVRTAPNHFLGEFPLVKWNSFRQNIPDDLTGLSVLDIGCNGGFYSLEMKRRGADRVVGIDFDDHYLNQAKFAASVVGADVEFRKLSVYDVGALRERFDFVLFLGVLYHLRHPLLALDLIYEHAANDWLIYQSLQRGSADVEPLEDDYDFWDMDHFNSPGYPKMHFIEKRYSHDETNWWAPNAACSAAMLRSAGFRIVDHPEQEIFVCRRTDVPNIASGDRVVYPARGDAEVKRG